MYVQNKIVPILVLYNNICTNLNKVFNFQSISTKIGTRSFFTFTNYSAYNNLLVPLLARKLEKPLPTGQATKFQATIFLPSYFIFPPTLSLFSLMQTEKRRVYQPHTACEPHVRAREPGTAQHVARSIVSDGVALLKGGRNASWEEVCLSQSLARDAEYKMHTCALMDERRIVSMRT